LAKERVANQLSFHALRGNSDTTFPICGVIDAPQKPHQSMKNLVLNISIYDWFDEIKTSGMVSREIAQDASSLLAHTIYL
jgi:hypothetical protein